LKFASFATPKTLIIVFRGGSTMETADRRLRNDWSSGLERNGPGYQVCWEILTG